MAAEDVKLIQTFNLLGMTVKMYNINGPTSYLQSTGQVIKTKNLQMKTIMGAMICGQPIVDATGADDGTISLSIKGKVGSNQGGGSGGSGDGVDLEAHWCALGGAEMPDASNLSARSFRLFVIGT